MPFGDYMVTMTDMRLLPFASLFLLLLVCPDVTPEPVCGLRYRIVGKRGGPAVILLAASVESSEVQFRRAIDLLAPEFACVLIDAPAHGADRRNGQPHGLDGWAYRLRSGEDLPGRFAERVRCLLEQLTRQREIAPSPVAIFGISRGGFLAFHLAARIPRIGCAAAIAPVTELGALREFSGCAFTELDARHLKLSVPVWVCIGESDERVSTAAAARFAASQWCIDFGLTDAPGHVTRTKDLEDAVAWILSR